MLNSRNRRKHGPRPGIAPLGRSSANRAVSSSHTLVNVSENDFLYDYERKVKAAFDYLVPTLKKIAALQHEADFEAKAQSLAVKELGFELPKNLLADAWVQQLDMKQLYAWCLFEIYQRYSDSFYSEDPLGSSASTELEFQLMLQKCGFHTLDLSPCADGRLAHVIRYVLRLPYRMVRRKSYAGALFDIEDSLDKWVETELKRFREAKPDSADSATRYLKTVVYHHSSVDPDHEGCAAHGSDTELAAKAGIERLMAFKQAIENTHCCGASIDCLLIGLDTDTDTIRIHMVNENGIDVNDYIDAGDLYRETRSDSASVAKQFILNRVQQSASNVAAGMQEFIAYLLANNMSQIDYVNKFYGGHYEDIGHAERFIGAGMGFEEVQLRNLTYFSYLSTVEEATADLDVGIKIFSGLNVAHGLPVPIVVRFDYHGHVPGSRERAIEHCQRVVIAINSRFESLVKQGLLHTLQAVRDVNLGTKIEVIDCSVKTETMSAH